MVLEPDGHPGRRRLRRLALVGVLAWVVFALAWWRVTQLQAQVGRPVLAALAACAVLVFSVTSWWVAHNRRIYREKGPRRGIPSGEYDYSVDRLGRGVELLPPDIRADEVVLEVTAVGTKSYRAAER